MILLVGRDDDAGSHDGVTVVHDGGLSRGDAVGRLVELELEAARPRCDGGGDGGRAVAELRLAAAVAHGTASLKAKRSFGAAVADAKEAAARREEELAEELRDTKTTGDGKTAGDAKAAGETQVAADAAAAAETKEPGAP